MQNLAEDDIDLERPAALTARGRDGMPKTWGTDAMVRQEKIWEILHVI